MLAAKTDIAALKLPEADAHELAVAITELNALYGGKGGLLGPKGYAWFNLCVALLGTYLPMGVNVKRAVAKKKTDAGTANLSTGA